MDIQRKSFESSNNVNPDWSFKFDEGLQQYVATDFEMTNYVEEFNEHWDTFRAGWQAAKAQAVPEGFVLVETSKINTWYQDDDEPENFCNSESDLDCLGDCLDDDDIIIVNVHESAHISTRKVFGVWKSNSPTDIQSKFILVDSRVEAEQVVAENKTMIEAQEQNQ